jgi:hypothetical protein
VCIPPKVQRNTKTKGRIGRWFGFLGAVSFIFLTLVGVEAFVLRLVSLFGGIPFLDLSAGVLLIG